MAEPHTFNTLFKEFKEFHLLAATCQTTDRWDFSFYWRVVCAHSSRGSVRTQMDQDKEVHGIGKLRAIKTSQHLQYHHCRVTFLQMVTQETLMKVIVWLLLISIKTSWWFSLFTAVFKKNKKTSNEQTKVGWQVISKFVQSLHRSAFVLKCCQVWSGSQNRALYDGHHGKFAFNSAIKNVYSQPHCQKAHVGFISSSVKIIYFIWPITPWGYISQKSQGIRCWLEISESWATWKSLTICCWQFYF